MCTVSVIFNTFSPMPDSWFTRDRIDLFKRMITDARLLDRETGQPGCEDPDKAKLEDRVDELEEKLEYDNKVNDHE